jgi:hypothetical protein
MSSDMLVSSVKDGYTELVRMRCEARRGGKRCRATAIKKQAVQLAFGTGQMRVWVKRCEDHLLYEYEGYYEGAAA